MSVSPAARPRSTCAASWSAAFDRSPDCVGLAAGAVGFARGGLALAAGLVCVAALLRDDINVVSFLHDLKFAQLQAPVGHAFAGLHVVLVAVPRADEMQLVLGEIEAKRGLVGPEPLLDLSDGEPLAGRSALVQAVVAVSVEFVLVAEHADLGIAEEHNATIAVLELGGLADELLPFRHSGASPHAPIA